MSKSKILFQMTGSIACYKACNVISKLVQAGHEVQVVASPSALQFVGAATLEGLTGKPVVSDLFAAGNIMDHIHLVRWADLIIVAPATANFVNKIAGGIGDDLLTTQFLAHDFKKPFLLAPAMNTAMYLHPVTQGSIQKLKSLGVSILETASGVLACGEVGWGKLLDPELIFQEIKTALADGPQNKMTIAPQKSVARKVLITSGGTQEPLDQVRVLANISTGNTGASLADSFVALGFDVTYLHAKNATMPQNACEQKSFTSFKDLESSLKNLLSTGLYSAVIHAAAVSDFSLKAQTGKISSDSDLNLQFTRNPKLVTGLREFAKNPNLLVVAFKMTASKDTSDHNKAVTKLFETSRANLVIHNDVNEIDPKTGKHPYRLYERQNMEPVLLENKNALGRKLGQILFEEMNKESL